MLLHLFPQVVDVAGLGCWPREPIPGESAKLKRIPHTYIQPKAPLGAIRLMINIIINNRIGLETIGAI
jgi:hypothetical protein